MLTDFEAQSRVEVLADLEPAVAELMADHERKRRLWMPAELLEELDEPEAEEDRRRALRQRARGLPDAVRVAVALNLVTEEGLPHFHRLIATRLGDSGVWHRWNCLWTAEEDRHGTVLHDYCRDTQLLHNGTLQSIQFEYLRSGFDPNYDDDPYLVFVYTTLQERATQRSHANTGRAAADYDPRLRHILGHVAGDEARHFAFYRQLFREILERDPDAALAAAARIMATLEMPGRTMPGFREMSEVIRRAGIYGPFDYLEIVEEQLRFWEIESFTGLGEVGRRAQEKLLGLPAKLRRAAEYLEAKSRAKSFRFDLIYGREIEL